MTLHRTLAGMLKAAREAGRPPFATCSPQQARDLLAASCAALGVGPEVGPIRDLEVPTRGAPIRARLYQPQTQPVGMIVYIHGGGWVLGTMDDFDALSRSIVARTNCALLLIDYRLAPEHPFPAGLEDVQDAIDWAAAHRNELVGSECCIIAAGDSAGANLATVALAGRSRKDVALQVLFYPVVDCDTNTPSYGLPRDDLFLSREDMQWFFRHYAPSDLWPDPRISPLRAPSLAGMPPAWIATAEYDVLRDEAEAYGRRLEAEGVKVWLRRFDGMGHGFVRMMNLVEDANSAFDDVARVIAERCAS
jgi:acetyl esterase